MPAKYAPALFLEVLAFWFVLRWLLLGRLILLVGRLLVLTMVVGTLTTLGANHFAWAASFAGAGLLAWLLLRRWQGVPLIRYHGIPVPTRFAWRTMPVAEVAALCERRIGLPVDAAAPATIADGSRSRCVVALAGDAVWVLEDESRLRCARIGRVLGQWDRTSLVSHVEHSRRAEHFEFSWPHNGALIRGVMPSGSAAELFAGHLAADELRH